MRSTYRTPSWIEIRPDNTVLFRTGKRDFGQGTIYTAYRQIVADELDMPFEAITTVVSADTDTTPEAAAPLACWARNPQYPEGGSVHQTGYSPACLESLVSPKTRYGLPTVRSRAAARKSPTASW